MKDDSTQKQLSGSKKWIKWGALSAIFLAVAIAAAVIIPGFFKTPPINEVEGDFVTVRKEVPGDGSTPDQYGALDNIAYMNYRLSMQKYWYSEMHGTTDTSIMLQDVSTFKQYNDGVLIMADITSSALVKSSRQFCYVGDEVIWRSGDVYTASSFEELTKMNWATGDPDAHMYLDDYIKLYGLPGTDFSVYIINEETLLRADEVVQIGGGKNGESAIYSQTIYLDPARDKAPAHYANKMVFSGGLTALPEFQHITITYVFDETWQILSCDIEESYRATMGISVNCVSKFHTDYEYDLNKSVSSDYENYYKQYVGGVVDGGPEKTTPTAVGCLGQAFGTVLTEPTSFQLSLNINETTIDGVVWIDLGNEIALDAMQVRAKFGDFSLWIEKGIVYLSYDDIRIKGSIQELLSFVSGATETRTMNSDGESFDLDSLLNELGNGVFVYDENKATLDASFTFGNISIPVHFSFLLDSDQNASLEYVKTNIALGNSSIGAQLSFGEEVPPALDEAVTEGYIEIMGYVTQMKSLLSSEVLKADIDYATGELQIVGSLQLRMSDKVIAGKIGIRYKNAEQELEMYYAEGMVYVEVGGVRVKGRVAEIVSLVEELIGLDEGSASERDLIEQVMSLDIREIMSVTEDDGILSAVVKTDAILAALGVELSVGDITLKVYEDALTAEAKGIKVSIRAGSAFEAVTEGYIEIDSALEKLVVFIEQQGISFGGTAQLRMENTHVTLNISQCVISWKNGFELYLDAEASVGGKTYPIKISFNDTKLQIAYGTFGAELIFEDVPDLEDALLKLYADLRNAIGQMSETEENPLPELEALSDVLQLILSSNNAQLSQSFDLEKLLSELRIENSENGILRVVCAGISIDLIETIDGLSLNVSYSDTDINVETEFSTGTFSGVPDMPEITYYTTEDYYEVIDSISALLNTLTQQNVTFDIESVTKNSDEIETQRITGTVEYYSGATLPIRFDLNNKNFYLNTDLYLRLDLTIDSLVENGTDLYLDIWILDDDKDNVLDAYISVSMLEETHSSYNPLVFRAPFDELMPLVSSAVSLFGIDSSFLNEYLIEKWFTVDTVKQLQTIGSSLFRSLSGMLGGSLKDLLEGSLTGTIADVEFVIEKQKDDAGRSLLSGFGVTSWAKDGNVANVSIGFDYSSVNCEEPVLSGTMQRYDLDGMTALFKALAQSTTHVATEEDLIDGRAEKEGDYVLNRTFYIQGNAVMKLALGSASLVEATVDVIAISISVGNDGEVALNARLQYDHKRVWPFDIINGDTTLDMTLKGNMLYMKRVQTSNAKGDSITPITIYRALPLANFDAHMMDHIAFMFNLSDTIRSLMDLDLGGNTQTGPIDYGTSADNILRSYAYRKTAQETDEWDITLNGNYLTDGVFGDMNIVIGTDDQGDIRTLKFKSSIVSVITLEASLRLCNPRNVTDSGVSDTTLDMAEFFEENLSVGLQRMREANWLDENGAATYLNAQPETISYLVNGNVVATQEVAFDDKKRIVTALQPPATRAEWIREGYTMSWEMPNGETFSERQISAKYTPNLYQVTFISDREIEGWEKFGNEYLYITEMLYDSEIKISLGGERLATYRVGLENTIQLPNIEADAVWENVEIAQDGATFVGRRNVDTVTYFSTVAYELNGERYEQYIDEVSGTYTLLTPTANGYVFVGWYRQNENGGWTLTTNLEWNDDVVENVELHALWLTAAQINAYEISSTGSLFWKKYYATSSVNLSNTVGLPAGSVTAELQSATFTYGKNTSTSYRNQDGVITNSNVEISGSGVSVTVKLTYRVSGKDIELTCTGNPT